MNIKFRVGDYVKITKDDGSETYGVLQKNVRKTKNSLVCDGPLNHVDLFLADPLTGEIIDGMWSINMSGVTDIEPIDTSILPTHFVILNAQTFELAFRLEHGSEDSSRAEILYRNLCDRMACLGTEMLQSPIEANRGLLSKNFTAVGLDFMRQNFRAIQLQTISELRVPSAEALPAIVSQHSENDGPHNPRDDDTGFVWGSV